MNSHTEKIERIVDEHQEYLESIAAGIVEGVGEGIKQGITEASKRGAKDALKECLAEGLVSIGEEAIDDVVDYAYSTVDEMMTLGVKPNEYLCQLTAVLREAAEKLGRRVVRGGFQKSILLATLDAEYR